MGIPPVPVRLGFFLERRGVTCSMYPTVRYEGVDRLPNMVYYDLSEGSMDKTEGVAGLWEEYSEAEEMGELNVDLTLAHRLQERFRYAEVCLDLVYAEVVAIPRGVGGYPSGELWSDTLEFVLEHRRAIHNRLQGAPESFSFLGFDISHPVPTFHSAIYQPGLHEVRPEYPRYLNRFGLFDDRGTAVQFLNAANGRDYGPLPFCLLGVWAG